MNGYIIQEKDDINNYFINRLNYFRINKLCSLNYLDLNDNICYLSFSSTNSCLLMNLLIKRFNSFLKNELISPSISLLLFSIIKLVLSFHFPSSYMENENNSLNYFTKRLPTNSLSSFISLILTFFSALNDRLFRFTNELNENKEIISEDLDNQDIIDLIDDDEKFESKNKQIKIQNFLNSDLNIQILSILFLNSSNFNQSEDICDLTLSNIVLWIYKEKLIINSNKLLTLIKELIKYLTLIVKYIINNKLFHNVSKNIFILIIEFK